MTSSVGEELLDLFERIDDVLTETHRIALDATTPARDLEVD